MKKYPGGSIWSPEWRAIRKRILERAKNKCEDCGIPNHEFVWNEKRQKEIEIVLTIAHLDGGLDDHSDENLAALCQRCHNTLDAPQRAKNAAETRRKRKAIGDLFDEG